MSNHLALHVDQLNRIKGIKKLDIPKLTRNQWIAASVAAVAAVVASMVFTNWWNGEAVEISVENAGSKPVFVYIDNTGRHGSGTAVDNLQTTEGKQTPSGLVIRPSQTRSFGTAVGLGDSPTMHIMPISDDGRADAKLASDCAFDTVQMKLEIPARHVKLRWNGDRCESTNQ